MKDFKLNNGDIAIFNNDVELINGNELIRQEVEKLIGTNKNEWFLNKNQGINFKNILTKNVNMNVVEDEILQALQMIDNTFMIKEFNYNIVGRNLTVNFKAINENGQEIEGVNTWD